jgi:hypothetical protein
MKLPARLLSAWRHTHYTTGTIDVMINRRSSEMDKLLTAYRVRSAVFVTAWNPLSHRMSVRWNQRMQDRLKQRLRRCVTLPAEGSCWRWREEHLLVLAAPGLVKRLARLFRQAAVVVVKRGQAAALTISFPVFSPLNNMPSASGALSNPSTT